MEKLIIIDSRVSTQKEIVKNITKQIVLSSHHPKERNEKICLKFSKFQKQIFLIGGFAIALQSTQK